MAMPVAFARTSLSTHGTLHLCRARSVERSDLRAMCETDYLDNLIENEIDFPELSEGR